METEDVFTLIRISNKTYTKSDYVSTITKLKAVKNVKQESRNIKNIVDKASFKSLRYQMRRTNKKRL